jgi:type IV pilus assembly protein PilY1
VCELLLAARTEQKAMKRARSGYLSSLIHWVVASACVFTVGANAAQVNLTQAPLFLGGMVQPNIFFTIDNSGGMASSFIPDSSLPLQGTKRGLAAERNPLAYNPRLVYGAPEGVPTPVATFSAAYYDGYTTTGTVNLSTSYQPSWTGVGDYGLPAQPAFYYVFSSDSACVGQLDNEACYVQVVVGASSGPEGSDERQNFANWHSYYRTRLNTAKAAVAIAVQELGEGARIGLGKTTDADTRLRDITEISAADLPNVLSDLFSVEAAGNSPLRRALDDVGKYFETTDQLWLRDPAQGASANNSAVGCRRAYHVLISDGYWSNGDSYTPAAASNNDGTTVNNPASPLISASDGSTYTYSPASPFRDTVAGTLADVAMYYWKRDLKTGANFPNNVPTSEGNPAFWQHVSTIAVGLGLETEPLAIGQPPHVDPATAFAAITQTSLNPINWPDPTSDQAARFDDLVHAAVNSRGDFFNLTEAGALQQLVDKLRILGASVPGTASSAASVVLSSGAYRTDTLLYQARFAAGTWTGQLLAYELASDGSLKDRNGDGVRNASDAIWDSGAISPLNAIPTSTSRKIASYRLALQNKKTALDTSANQTKPIAFTWANLSPYQQLLWQASDAANGADIVAYVRGNLSEATRQARGYRVRATPGGAPSLLGDIVNSAPVYVGAPISLYPDYWPDGDITDNQTPLEDAHPYSAFRISKAQRCEVIYAGANDGMLHAFDALRGNELFAYIPAAVIKKLNLLKDPQYSLKHQYFVDGSATVGDAYLPGKSNWRTVLVSGLGAGGQGVFALDATDPGTKETDGQCVSSVGADSDVVSRVLWEYTDLHNPDLGFTFGQPSIVRERGTSGTWRVLFGNGLNNAATDGYPSTSGTAKLIGLDAEIGPAGRVDIWDTGIGSVATPNGLVGVAPVDLDGDRSPEVAYGGDIQGNLWRFDLTSRGSKGTLVFKARDGSGRVQPITTRPEAVRGPNGVGVVVLFGTGSYLAINDADLYNTATQSFYGIWDDATTANTCRDSATTSSCAPLVDRGDLLQQEILREVSVGVGQYQETYRVTTDYSPSWKISNNDGEHLGWYMDLYNTENNSTDNFGERQVSDSVVRGSNLIFTTLIPAPDTCDFGGSGWLMELDALTGGWPAIPTFYRQVGVDEHGLAVYEAQPATLTVGQDQVSPGGRKSRVGIVPTPAILSRAGGKTEEKFMSGSTGQIDEVRETGEGYARQSWVQYFQ